MLASFRITIGTITGSIRKLVTCSGCGQQYNYVATREGWAYSAPRPFPFFFFSERAKRELLERAKKKLALRLERAVDLVPCPHCGILQPNMIRPKRHEKEKTIFLLVGVVVGVILLAIYQSHLKSGRLGHYNAVAVV
jgi:hypothetical protein